MKAWRRFREALDQLRAPAEEVVDGALVLVGGALMLTPGFVTDAVGLVLVVPPTRALLNRLIRRRVRMSFRFGSVPPRAPRQREDGEVVDVEVLSVERDRPGGTGGAN